MRLLETKLKTKCFNVRNSREINFCSFAIFPSQLLNLIYRFDETQQNRMTFSTFISMRICEDLPGCFMSQFWFVSLVKCSISFNKIFLLNWTTRIKKYFFCLDCKSKSLRNSINVAIIVIPHNLSGKFLSLKYSKYVNEINIRIR